MQAWGILIDGHPTDDYNGAYQKTIPQDAIMSRPTRVLKNPRGMYCYRHEPKDMWILRNKHTPDKPNCNACIVSKDGPLPLGAQTWKLSPAAVGKPKGSGYVDKTLSVVLLEIAPAAAATKQLDAVAAVSIGGHPDSAINGVYRHDSTHEGWPVLKNARGKYCYRARPWDKWLLWTEFTPDESTCNAYIVAREGLLPVGAHTWRCWVDGKFVDGTLTVALLVRLLLPCQPHAPRCVDPN